MLPSWNHRTEEKPHDIVQTFFILLKKNITVYQLIFKEGISANTLHRLKKGFPIKAKTLDVLCFMPDCEAEDILVHDKEKNK